jgi:hypothetical protein
MSSSRSTVDVDAEIDSPSTSTTASTSSLASTGSPSTYRRSDDAKQSFRIPRGVEHACGNCGDLTPIQRLSDDESLCPECRHATSF